MNHVGQVQEGSPKRLERQVVLAALATAEVIAIKAGLMRHTLLLDTEFAARNVVDQIAVATIDNELAQSIAAKTGHEPSLAMALF